MYFQYMLSTDDYIVLKKHQLLEQVKISSKYLPEFEFIMRLCIKDRDTSFSI